MVWALYSSEQEGSWLQKWDMETQFSQGATAPSFTWEKGGRKDLTEDYPFSVPQK